jgi:hypothetical protein
MVFDTCYTGDDVRGWRMELFHEGFGLFIPTQSASTTYKVQIWHVVSDIIAADEFEYKFWDPGSSKDQLSSQFMRHSADFIPAPYRELHIAWSCVIVLTQQKCSEPYKIACEVAVGGIVFSDYVLELDQVHGSKINCLVLVSAQLHFSVASCKEFSLACIVFKISTTAVMWCSSVVLLIWMSIGAVMFSGFCAQLEATDVDILSMDRDQIIAIISDSQLFTDNWKIQCCQLILAFKWLLIQHSTVSKGMCFKGLCPSLLLCQLEAIIVAKHLPENASRLDEKFSKCMCVTTPIQGYQRGWLQIVADNLVSIFNWTNVAIQREGSVAPAAEFDLVRSDGQDHTMLLLQHFDVTLGCQWWELFSPLLTQMSELLEYKVASEDFLSSLDFSTVAGPHGVGLSEALIEQGLKIAWVQLLGQHCSIEYSVKLSAVYHKINWCHTSGSTFLHASDAMRTLHTVASAMSLQPAELINMLSVSLLIDKDLNSRVITSAQLQVSVSFWCTGMNHMWRSQWEPYWKNCAAEILMPWDPEISEFFKGAMVLRVIKIEALQGIHCAMTVFSQRTMRYDMKTIPGLVFLDGTAIVGVQTTRVVPGIGGRAHLLCQLLTEINRLEGILE